MAEAAAAAVAPDLAVDLGEERVVLADADVATRIEAGTALPNEDGSAVHALAAERLDAQPLRVGVAAVLGGRRALLVCHEFSPSVVEPVETQSLMSVTLTWVYFWR